MNWLPLLLPVAFALWPKRRERDSLREWADARRALGRIGGRR